MFQHQRKDIFLPWVFKSEASIQVNMKKYDGPQVVVVIKSPPASVGDVTDSGSVPGSGRSPGGGHGSPLQYSCLENPMDRGAWWATVHGVTKSPT